jgi:hypothetical protein
MAVTLVGQSEKFAQLVQQFKEKERAGNSTSTGASKSVKELAKQFEKKSKNQVLLQSDTFNKGKKNN